MAMQRPDTFRELLRVRHHRLFQEQLTGEVESMRSSAGGWSPLVDLFEDAEGITLMVELPEVKASDVGIEIMGNVLTLRGERKLESALKREGYHRIERYYGIFSRSFTLPVTVAMERFTSESRDGVLRIFLPKRTGAEKPLHVPVASKQKQ